MKRMTILRVISMSLLLLWTSITLASYVPAEILLIDRDDAMAECPNTCASVVAYWTGSWWTSADPVSVCECVQTCPSWIDIDESICIPLDP